MPDLMASKNFNNTTQIKSFARGNHAHTNGHVSRQLLFLHTVNGSQQESACPIGKSSQRLPNSFSTPNSHSTTDKTPLKARVGGK